MMHLAMHGRIWNMHGRFAEKIVQGFHLNVWWKHLVILLGYLDPSLLLDRIKKSFSHQIQHKSSAPRLLDGWFGVYRIGLNGT